MQWWYENKDELNVEKIIHRVRDWIRRQWLDREVLQDIQELIGFDLSPPPSPLHNPLPHEPRSSQRTTAQRHPTRNTRTPYEDSNPPTIILLPPRVKKCYGCRNKFTDNHRKPPKNLIFTMKAFRDDVPVVPFRPARTFFHLNLNCLRLERSTIDEPDIIMHLDTYRKLDQEHLDVLKSKGWLRYIEQRLFSANNNSTD